MFRSGRYSETTVKSYNQWPAQPEGFREACEEYTVAVVHLANLLLGLITVSLGLPFNLFHHCFDKENTIRARLNYYPQCPLANMVCGVNRYDSLSSQLGAHAKFYLDTHLVPYDSSCLHELKVLLWLINEVMMCFPGMWIQGHSPSLHRMT